MRLKPIPIALLSVFLAVQALPAAEDAPARVRALPDRPDLRGGICVVLGEKAADRAVRIARDSKMIVFVQIAGADDLLAAQRAVDQAGLYGTRVFLSQGKPAPIHLADNLADVVFAPADRAGAAREELLRVLRPGGQAIVGGERFTKPLPDGTDDWSHYYHGPDNNPQSTDRLARAPYLTQFIVEPRYGSCPQACVAAGGRVFMAFGHVAWHRREEPWLNTLVALNGYNGTMLWRRKLPSGIMVDRNTMIATPTKLFVGDREACNVIDPATGKLTDRIEAPADLTDGSFWKWMALSDGVLYALVGEAEPADPVALWRSRRHGWPWGGISKGYNQPQYRWGFARTLLAVNPKTKKVLWHHREAEPADSRGTCLAGGRIFLSSFGKYLVCLDAASGKELWAKRGTEAAELFKKIGPFNPGHGYRPGWKSTIYLRASDKALYFCGPQIRSLTAVSAADGRHLWTRSAKLNVHVVIRDDGLYVIGAQGTQNSTHKLDPMTGKVLASYGVVRRACTRSTGSIDSILFRSHGDGTTRLDLATGKPQWISPMRSSCHVGVVIAHGHLYWIPWVCDCNLQMFGSVGCAPAGEFTFGRMAADADRLVASAGGEIARFRPQRGDWPTYRANNARTATTWSGVPAQTARLWHYRPEAPFEATAPVAAGGMVFLGGSDGIVRALDARSGKLRWKAYTGGAVRFPPAIAGPRALVGSADGWAYAFEAATGRLLWRFRGAPADRRINFYGRLVSTWPVAAGVLVDKGTAYLAAGLNNYDGTHLYALDAATGRIKWQNNAPPAAGGGGPGVQGELLLAGDRLYLAGGSAASPAIYDMASGKLAEPGTPGRRGRELRLTAAPDRRGQRRTLVRVSGQPLYSGPEYPVYDNSSRWELPLVRAGDADLVCRTRREKEQQHSRLVALDPANNSEMWSQPLPARPVRWGVAVDGGGRIVVTLTNGQVLCFGPKP